MGTAVESLMFREAAQASAVVARQAEENGPVIARLGETLRRLRPGVVVTCARGSSDHAATFAKYLIESTTGVPTASAAPSMASLYGKRLRLDGALFLAISQSGQSPDLLSAVAAARAGGALVVAMVNDVDSPLAGMADQVVPLCAGAERSVAATKSYIAALAAIVSLVTEWAQDEALAAAGTGLPKLLDEAWALDWSPLVEALQPASQLYMLARGIGLGAAQEAALKLKETSRLHAEAFSAAEVRHGPMALVGPGFPILLLRQSDETEAGMDEVIGDLAGRGAKVLVAGAAPDGAVSLPTVSAHPVLEPLLQIQSFYRAANALAFARGFDPDRPAHLAKVTETL
jgi:glucosamine--fructose-6-phosphate aminotransferase (isomerizing)